MQMLLFHNHSYYYGRFYVKHLLTEHHLHVSLGGDCGSVVSRSVFYSEDRRFDPRLSLWIKELAKCNVMYI